MVDLGHSDGPWQGEVRLETSERSIGAAIHTLKIGAGMALESGVV